MIVSFKIKNFLSFRDEFVLDFSADGLKEHKDYVHMPYRFDEKLRLLKSIAIYGHNSHGKSNFLKAFDFFLKFIQQSSHLGLADGLIPIENFTLQTKSSKEPSLFEAIFIVGDTKFRYGFTISAKSIYEEWLFYSLPKVRENNLFARTGEEIKVNKNWNKEASGKIEQATTFAKPKVLLLSVLLQQVNVSMVDKIGAWLLNNKVILDLTTPKLLHDSTTILAEPDYRRLINQFIKAAKLGFETIEERIEGMSKNSLNISAEIIRLAHYKEIEKFELYTKHELYDESFILKDYVYFDMLTNESAGTQRYFILVAQLVYALKKGQILWIDEIDSRFHTLLLQLLVKLYNSKKNNVNGSQLIFTSHNTSLLNRQLRRDQINFVEKDKFGASSIVRMHTAKTPIRAESAIEKDYLRGDLGGIGLFAQDEEIK